MKHKFTISTILGVLLLVFLVYGLYSWESGSSGGFSGTYAGGTYSFPISAMTFYNDGTMDLSMDEEYTGRYEKDGNQFKIKIVGGNDPVSESMAEQAKETYNITAVYNSDDTLTVYVEPKRGVVYWGDESAVFERR